MKESAYCFAHNPQASQQRRQACSQGGRNRRRPRCTSGGPTTPDLQPPASVTELAHSLAEVYAQIRSGQLDPKVGNTLASLAARLLSAYELAELAERVTRLEQQMQRRYI